MVGMTGVEPAWTSSQNWWVTVTLHPESTYISYPFGGVLSRVNAAFLQNL